MFVNEIVAKTKALNFPTGEYVVFGSCPLAVAGIRQSGDIDIVVSKPLLLKLKQDGWSEISTEPTSGVTKDVFDVHDKWNFGNYRPTVEQLLTTATFIEGVPFAALEEVRKWKIISDRPKDRRDVELIDEYLAKQTKAF